MNFKGARALVTGASGYLGSWMTEKLLDAGADCVAMIRPQSSCSMLKHIKQKFQQVSVDLTSSTVDTLTREIGQVDHIFHLAAAGVNQNSDNIGYVADVNIGGSLTVLNYAREIGAQSVVFTGSGFEYPAGLSIDEATSPDPRSFYALTKAASSMAAMGFAHAHALPVVVLRPFVVYGPREAEHRLTTQVCRAALKNRSVNITSGSQLRDWIYVEDAIDAHLRAALAPGAKGQIINVASGNAVSVRYIAETIAGLAKADSELLNFGGMESRPNEIWEQSGSQEKAKKLLDWSATTSLVDGLAKTLAWYRHNDES